MVIKRTEKEQEFLRKIGNRIKKARIASGISQVEFNKKLGYTTVYSLYRIEIGTAKALDIIILRRIAELLGTTLCDLIK